jgi:hypothetical protein
MTASVLDVKVTCKKCGLLVSGRLHFDAQMRLVDSDGGIAFVDGWSCHNCLGQPWASADSVLELGGK